MTIFSFYILGCIIGFISVILIQLKLFKKDVTISFCFGMLVVSLISWVMVLFSILILFDELNILKRVGSIILFKASND